MKFKQFRATVAIEGNKKTKMAYQSQLCSINGCSKLKHSRGWCKTHYNRWWSHGSTDKLKQGREFGYTVPLGTRNKISKANKGKKRTSEQRAAFKLSRQKMWAGYNTGNKLERARFRRRVRSLVLQRDDYTCQICEQKDGRLQVDHIKKWANYPELRYQLDNCRTVCMACHYYITFKRKIPEGLVWGHTEGQS